MWMLTASIVHNQRLRGFEQWQERIDGQGMLNWQSGKVDVARSGREGTHRYNYHLGKVLNFLPMPMDSWHRYGSDQFQVTRLSISSPNTS